MSLGKRKKQGTMFVPSTYKGLSEVVRVDSPTNARKSVAELKRRFAKLKHRDARLSVKRAAVLAANRAEAMAKKKDLCTKERIELNEVKRIYRRAGNRMML